MRKISMAKLLSLFFVTAYAARTVEEDPLQKFKFTVSIPGIPASVGFNKCSGLSEEVNVAEYNEGGTQYALKFPGRPKVGEVTLERGEYASDELHALLRSTIMDSNLRNTIIITKKNRYGTSVRTYKLANAWCSKWEGSDMDAGSDDVAIEKVTLQFEHFL